MAATLIATHKDFHSITEIYEVALNGQTTVSITTNLGVIDEATVHSKTGFTNATYKADVVSIAAPIVGVACDHAGETTTVVVTARGHY